MHAAEKPIKFDCGGACALGSTMDFLRFSQMLLDGGALDGQRLLSRKTVELMTADHLVDDVRGRASPALVPPGYGFGLGFLVRKQTGAASTLGSAGEYGWGGAYGTYFLIDPKEQLVIVYMTAAPGAVFQNRLIVKNLVTQSIID
jgi:CubicO group peptidase (beta-lactamase class C family)